MGLKISLNPHERFIICGAVVTNGHAKCELIIENRVPILREKDILNEDSANSPARRIYFSIQVMYIDEDNIAEHHNSYWRLVKDFLLAAPSATGLIDQISDRILRSEYYQALKLAKKLIDYEQEIIDRVT